MYQHTVIGNVAILATIKISLLSICICFFEQSFCQSNNTEIKHIDCDISWRHREKIDIREVVISDSILIVEIQKLIKEESDQNEMFRRGLGYIYVIPDYDLEENIVRSYYINIDYTALKTLDSYPKAYLAYPNFYAFVENRLVFIRLQMLDGMFCFRYSNRSMRKIRKIQYRFLEEEKQIDAFDSQGRKVFTDKHFRIDYSKLHGGKYIYIHNDHTYKVKNDPYKH